MDAIPVVYNVSHSNLPCFIEQLLIIAGSCNHDLALCFECQEKGIMHGKILF